MPRLYKFNEDREGFGTNLKRLMIEKGFTIESFSNKVGYDENTVKKWRSGQRIPSLKNLQDLSKILGVTVQELYLPNSIYEKQISEDFKKVIDGKFEIKPSDKILIDELTNYSNYFFQKMLFSYLNPRDVKTLRNLFKYFLLTDYAVDRLSITDKSDFDEFYAKVKRYLVEQYGKSLPYRIDNEMSKKILNDFNKFIALNIKEEM